jgi:2-haloalkanoic acid dehalogenase type II
LTLRPDIVTFDCYGTLIDWETGIRNAFRKALAGNGPAGVDEGKVSELYEDEEKKVEKEKYRPYREVLAETARRVAGMVGWELPPEEAGFLAEDLPNWRPFNDTNPALERLSGRCRLGILSNVDEDLLAGTLNHLSVSFDPVVTAEQVRSYKPGVAHFVRAREIVGGSSWFHVAASLYHDIMPAVDLGVGVVWVNRKGLAVPHSVSGGLVGVVGGLGELAGLLGF